MSKYSEQDEYPVIAASVILINQKKEILLAKRATEPYKSAWSLVAERVKVTDDNIEMTVRRGVREETGLEVKVINLVDVFANPKVTPPIDPRFYTIQVVYVAEVIGGETTQTQEIEDFKWVSLEEAINTKLAFNHNEILSVYKKKGEAGKLISAERTVFPDYLGKEFIYKQNIYPRFVVDAIILNEKNEVLMGLRSQWPYIDYWDFPGGHIYVGETLEECIKREAKEEVGVEIEVGELFQVYSDKGHSPKYMDVVLFYFAKMKSQNFEKNIEIQDYGFFPLTALPGKVAYAHECCLTDLKKYLKI